MNNIEKTSLYYFTGTGNSLLAAREVANKLTNCELIPIASLRGQNKISCETMNMGLVFPLYFEGLPSIVLDFIERIDIEKVKYFFCIITRGTPIGSGGLFMIKSILKKKSYNLDCGFYLNMPWNYIIALPPPSNNSQKKIIKKARKKIEKIVAIVNNKKRKLDIDPMFFINFFVNKNFIKKVNNMDNIFTVNNNCNSCGQCKKICSVNNINLVNGKPEWKNNCEQCLGCLNICPQNSINFGKRTGFKQYINPELKKEFLLN